MPTPPKNKAAQKVIAITAWSFSRYNDYQKCPAYAMYKHVQRIKEPGSPALDRGSAIHALAERFAAAKRTAKCPEELATFKEEFKDLQKRRVMLEQQWAFDEQWSPTSWFDTPGAPSNRQPRCRVVVDCCYMDLERNVLVIIDHKTGKINEDHLNQLSLYALAGLIQFPDAEGVDVQLWYLDHGVIMPETKKIYERSELKSLIKMWEKKAKPMLADRRFAPRPSQACRYCFFSTAKNGPCKY